MAAYGVKMTPKVVSVNSDRGVAYYSSFPHLDPTAVDKNRGAIVYSDGGIRDTPGGFNGTRLAQMPPPPHLFVTTDEMALVAGGQDVTVCYKSGRQVFMKIAYRVEWLGVEGGTDVHLLGRPIASPHIVVAPADFRETEEIPPCVLNPSCSYSETQARVQLGLTIYTFLKGEWPMEYTTAMGGVVFMLTNLGNVIALTSRKNVRCPVKLGPVDCDHDKFYVFDEGSTVVLTVGNQAKYFSGKKRLSMTFDDKIKKVYNTSKQMYVQLENGKRCDIKHFSKLK